MVVTAVKFFDHVLMSEELVEKVRDIPCTVSVLFGVIPASWSRSVVRNFSSQKMQKGLTFSSPSLCFMKSTEFRGVEAVDDVLVVSAKLDLSFVFF